MTTERDLDARLQAARGVREEDLPALSAAFLDYLHASTDADPSDAMSLRGPARVPAETPASVLAAQQLVTDAQQRRGVVARSRRRPDRKAVVRIGVAMLAVAAAATTAVVVISPHRDRPPAASPGSSHSQTQTPPAGTAVPTQGPIDPPGGLTLVAAEAITFPYSLDPPPAGLTPILGKSGGVSPFGHEPVVWGATYRSADDPGFTFSISSQDPRERPKGGRPQDFHSHDHILQTGTVPVNGEEADFVRGDYASPECRDVPSTPDQTKRPAEVCSNSFAELFWQRPDDQWVYLWGEGHTYSKVAALASVARTIVDRPQPVPLQVGLSPAGWSVSSYEDNRALTLISDDDPSISNRISVSLQERWRGYTSPDAVLEGMARGNPVEHVTVKGQPAELVSMPAHSTGPEGPGHEKPQGGWILAAQFPGGPVFLLQAPGTLSREDVLAIADGVTYTP